MRAFETRKSASLMARHRILIPVLAVMVLGSVVFAAAGGVDMVKGWFITMTVEVDGQVVAVEEVELDGEGKATVVLPAEVLDEGEELGVTLESEEILKTQEGEAGTATVKITVEDSVAQIQMEVTEEDTPEE